MDCPSKAAVFNLDAIFAFGKINAQLSFMSEEEQKDILRVIWIFREFRDDNSCPPLD